MADVFISYSKQAPQPTRDLARDLEERGFTVWWDTELLAGDEFHDKIKAEITAAKIVIVIWSPASIKSSFTLHGLRHTHISHLLMDGVHVKVVSERAGHANVNITLNTYAAYIPNMQADAAVRVNAWLR